jgi:hypothetical protein
VQHHVGNPRGVVRRERQQVVGDRAVQVAFLHTDVCEPPAYRLAHLSMIEVPAAEWLPLAQLPAEDATELSESQLIPVGMAQGRKKGPEIGFAEAEPADRDGAEKCRCLRAAEHLLAAPHCGPVEPVDVVGQPCDAIAQQRGNPFFGRSVIGSVRPGEIIGIEKVQLLAGQYQPQGKFRRCVSRNQLVHDGGREVPVIAGEHGRDDPSSLALVEWRQGK